MSTDYYKTSQSSIDNNYNQSALLSEGTGNLAKLPISVRECTCLNWVAMGKTTDEITDILKISKHTVHFHTRNAIRTLDASNKTHAVTKAIVSKYITISHDVIQK